MGEWRIYDKRGRLYWAFLTGSKPKQRKSTGQSDKRAAEAVVSRWNRERADPASQCAPVTLSKCIAAYVLERGNRGRSAETLKMHTKKGANLLRILGVDTPINDIDAEAVDRFVAARLEEKVPRTERPITRSTIGKELSTLRGALRLARRRGHYKYEYTAVMPIGWSNDYEPRKKHPSPEQFAALLAQVPNQARRRHLAFLVATGADIGESFLVELADIDLEKMEVTLHGKKNKYRDATIPVSPLGHALLRHAVEHAPKKGPIFAKWDNVRRSLAEACAKAGIPYYSPKDLRRACSSWLVQKGVDLFAVSKIMRHGSTRMVEQVYGHHIAGTLGAVVSKQLAAAAPPKPATVTRLCSTGSYRGDFGDVCDSGVDLDRAEETVPGGGIEPSTRGFSRRTTRGDRPSLRRCGVKGTPSNVPLLCPERAEPLGPQALAVLHAVGHALAGDEVGALGLMLEASRLAGVA
jgi:integrase